MQNEQLSETPSDIWQQLVYSLPKRDITERARVFLERIQRQAVRECTARYRPEDRANFRLAPAAQAKLDQPVIREKEASLISEMLPYSFPIEERARAMTLIREMQTRPDGALLAPCFD